MSVDYRPYLAATDLRTPEDVLAWLMSEVYPDESTFTKYAVGYKLVNRLDRERRQACRRGALYYWQAWRRSLSPMWTDDPKTDFEDELWAGENTFECCWGFDCLSNALAFRAAARAK